MRLNGTEVMAAPSDGTYSFNSRLLSGASYSVAVASQPTSPDQVCTPASPSGVISTAPVTIMVVCGAPPAVNNTHSVGGTVSGLVGTDLRLTMNQNTQRVDVTRNGAFRFPNNLQDGDDYEVVVGRQPSNPAQTCTVANGSGRINGANVTNVAVSCSGASTLALAFTNGPLSARAVKATLYAAGGSRVAVLRSGVTVATGGGQFALVAPDDAGQASPPPASLAAGTYTLITMLNTDGSVDGSDAPTYEPEDHGNRQDVTLGTGVSATVTVSMNDLLPLVWEPVIIAGINLPVDASMGCSWSLPVGTRPALPLADRVGVSALNCPSESVPCVSFVASLGMTAGVTNVHDPMVPGSYDITCWLDRGGTNNGPDNIFNAGDRAGFLANVPVDGPGVLTSQAIVTLDPP